jgi:protein TonB
MLSFTVGRGGQLLGSRLARSSGSAALDAETQAMLRRAQPLPAFPPELPGTSLNFTVPVRFSIR